MKSVDQSPISFDTFSFRLETCSSPFSLTPFLYMGGAAIKKRQAASLEDCDNLIEERIPLIRSIYEEFRTKIASGVSDRTISNYYYGLNRFFRWADEEGLAPTRSTLLDNYLDYTEHLLHRNRTLKNLKEASVYAMASYVSSILEGVLGLQNGLLLQSRIRKPSSPPPWKGSQEQALDTGTQEMGCALLSVSNALSLESICGPLPIQIALKDGKQIVLGLRGYRDAISPLEDGSQDIKKMIERRRAIVNFRIEIELLIFISQTGMNLEQVRT